MGNTLNLVQDLEFAKCLVISSWNVLKGQTTPKGTGVVYAGDFPDRSFGQKEYNSV